MQPISTSATTSVPEFPRVDTSYTPHHQYDSTDALSTSRPSPQISRSESNKSPTTPGLQLTSMELSRNTRIVDDAAALTSPRLFLWARHIMTRWFTEWWMLEIMSWCFSAMCMVAIIGILIIYDGHGIPSWPLGLTINGFVIVFSNLAKSALLLSTAEALGQLKWNWFGQESRPLMFFEWIDMASRGPWGALLLLIKNRGMYGMPDCCLFFCLVLTKHQNTNLAWCSDCYPSSSSRCLFPANSSVPTTFRACHGRDDTKCVNILSSGWSVCEKWNTEGYFSPGHNECVRVYLS